MRFTGLLLVVALGLLPGCSTPPVLVQKVEFGGSIWSAGQRRAGVLFQDGGQSIPVSGGTLWLFGDTFYGQPPVGLSPQNSQIKGARWTTIALLPTDHTNLPPILAYYTNRDGLVANPIDLLPGEDEKHHRIWPAGGVSLGSRFYLYYSLIETTDAPGPWNFHGLGGGLSVAEEVPGHFTRLQPDGHWKFPVEPVQVLREGEVLYLFEVSSQPKGLLLARVKVAEIEHPAAYEFFTGAGWSNQRAQAKVVLKEAYGQVSVMRLPGADDYLLATSSDPSHPREIQLRRSRHLEGPWSAPVRLAVPEFPGKKTELVYCTFLHPELSGTGSQQLVATFCRTLEGNWNLCNPEWVLLTLGPPRR